MVVEKNGKIIVAMPGPPREMRAMWEHEVIPRLRGRVKGDVLVTRVLKITGLAESAVDEMCGDLLHGRSPTIGVYAKADGIHLRLGAKAANEAAAYQIISPVEQQLRRIFGAMLWGADDETSKATWGNSSATTASVSRRWSRARAGCLPAASRTPQAAQATSAAAS